MSDPFRTSAAVETPTAEQYIKLCGWQQKSVTTMRGGHTCSWWERYDGATASSVDEAAALQAQEDAERMTFMFQWLATVGKAVQLP